MHFSRKDPWTPLVAITRSGIVESVHYGAVAVVDGTGETILSEGDVSVPIFWRSTAKFHQALPLIAEGGAEAFRLEKEHLAVMCASHNGEAWQTQRVAEILRNADVPQSALKCGIHEPYGKEVVAHLIRAGEKPTTLHNTCSGNHAGLLALTRVLGAEIENYNQRENPAQERALDIASLFSGVAKSEIRLGMDGCGIPTYGTSLSSLAAAYARLAAVPPDFPEKYRDAADKIFAAVGAWPEMLSGPGELDVEFVRAFRGDALCKLGAECLCGVAVRPTARWPKGLGIAIKISDGLGNRARPIVLSALVRKLELGSAEQRQAFRVNSIVYNNLGAPVGDLECIAEFCDRV